MECMKNNHCPKKKKKKIQKMNGCDCVVKKWVYDLKKETWEDSDGKWPYWVTIIWDAEPKELTIEKIKALPDEALLFAYMRWGNSTVENRIDILSTLADIQDLDLRHALLMALKEHQPLFFQHGHPLCRERFFAKCLFDKKQREALTNLGIRPELDPKIHEVLFRNLYSFTGIKRETLWREDIDQAVASIEMNFFPDLCKIKCRAVRAFLAQLVLKKRLAPSMRRTGIPFHASRFIFACATWEFRESWAGVIHDSSLDRKSPLRINDGIYTAVVVDGKTPKQAREDYWRLEEAYASRKRKGQDLDVD